MVFMSLFDKISNLIGGKKNVERHYDNNATCYSEGESDYRKTRSGNMNKSTESSKKNIKIMSVNADIANLIWFADGERKNYENIGAVDWHFGNDLGYVHSAEPFVVNGWINE